MTTTPTLPLHPLPDSSMTLRIAGRDVEIDAFRASTMHEYALASYQAGRDAGLEEAAKVPRAYADQLDKGIFGARHPEATAHIFNASTNMAHNIRALKSDTKGGA